jgi:undecaprenyl diphosphate synthase
MYKFIEPPTRFKSTIFTDRQLDLLNPYSIPQHIAIIPDGNRRWAKRQKFTISQGHSKGIDNLMEIVKAARDIGIKTLTFYLLSTENWSRDTLEIKALMWLLETYLREQRQNMIENHVRVHSIGNTMALPESIQRVIEETKMATAECQEINVILALNYGGRDELCRAFHKILMDYTQKEQNSMSITEDLICQYLDTAAWKDPDLLIRTAGEQRLSNFLLWQSSYTELYIAQPYWPEFTPIHLLEAVLQYQKRERRLGGG